MTIILSQDEEDRWFEPNVFFSVEGWRTAAVVCRACGVSLILSRTTHVMEVHYNWHLRKGDQP